MIAERLLADGAVTLPRSRRSALELCACQPNVRLHDMGTGL